MGQADFGQAEIAMMIVIFVNTIATCLAIYQMRSYRKYSGHKSYQARHPRVSWFMLSVFAGCMIANTINLCIFFFTYKPSHQGHAKRIQFAVYLILNDVFRYGASYSYMVRGWILYFEVEWSYATVDRIWRNQLMNLPNEDSLDGSPDPFVDRQGSNPDAPVKRESTARDALGNKWSLQNREWFLKNKAVFGNDIRIIGIVMGVVFPLTIFLLDGIPFILGVITEEFELWDAPVRVGHIVCAAIFYFSMYKLTKNLKKISDQHHIGIELNAINIATGITWTVGTSLSSFAIRLNQYPIWSATIAAFGLSTGCSLAIYFGTSFVVQRIEDKQTNSRLHVTELKAIPKSQILTLNEVLSTRMGFEMFAHYLIKELSVENILWLVEVKQFKSSVRQIHARSMERAMAKSLERKKSKSYKRKNQSQSGLIGHSPNASDDDDESSESQNIPSQTPDVSAQVPVDKDTKIKKAHTEMESVQTATMEDDPSGGIKPPHDSPQPTQRVVSSSLDPRHVPEITNESSKPFTISLSGPNSNNKTVSLKSSTDNFELHDWKAITSSTTVRESPAIFKSKAVGSLDWLPKDSRLSSMSPFEYAHHLYFKYVDVRAELQINLPSRVKRKIDKFFRDNSDESISRDPRGGNKLFVLYDQAWEEIWKLMDKDTFHRFKLSQDYAQLCTTHYEKIQEGILEAQRDSFSMDKNHGHGLNASQFSFGVQNHHHGNKLIARSSAPVVVAKHIDHSHDNAGRPNGGAKSMNLPMIPSSSAIPVRKEHPPESVPENPDEATQTPISLAKKTDENESPQTNKDGSSSEQALELEDDLLGALG